MEHAPYTLVAEGHLEEELKKTIFTTRLDDVVNWARKNSLCRCLWDCHAVLSS
jgi:NADH:ubiquinone oxidoreductase subunit B-like Fe-S oxidoreductase